MHRVRPIAPHCCEWRSTWTISSPRDCPSTHGVSRPAAWNQKQLVPVIHTWRRLMYCPDCGTQTSMDQKFCRGCGVSLAALCQPQAMAGATPYANTSGEVNDERQKYKRLGFILFWSGILLAALISIVGDAMGTLSWRLGHFIQHLSGLGGLVLVAGLGFMIYS